MIIHKEDTHHLLYRFPQKGFRKVAFFDLDYTLIKPKSGRKFPKDGDDYMYLYPTVIERLNDYIQKGYMIAIVSNQNHLFEKPEKLDGFIHKLKAVFRPFDAKHITILVACGENQYRKPERGLFDLYESHYKIHVDRRSSFFCGDALGRAADFSDSDAKFAKNCGLRIVDPETMFGS